jgi:hypothetical protein
MSPLEDPKGMRSKWANDSTSFCDQGSGWSHRKLRLSEADLATIIIDKHERKTFFRENLPFYREIIGNLEPLNLGTDHPKFRRFGGVSP